MASGGGSHPSHLPISAPSLHSQSLSSQTNSLQTPDTRSLFVSSLGGSGGGIGGANFAPSPLDHSQSFTSLEELLNVTGINSLDLGVTKKSDHGGVDSLQQLAREVEDSQGPPRKQPCLDSSLSANHISGTQPLSTVLPTSSSSSCVKPSSSVQPIASLLDKKPPITSSFPSLVASALPNTNTTPLLALSNGPLSPPASTLPPPPPYSFSPITSVASSVSQTLTRTSQFPSNAQLGQFPTMLSQTQLQATTNSPLRDTNNARPSLPSSLSSTSLLASTNGKTQAVVAPVTNTAITSSRIAENINSSSKTVVLQLMQLYRQYQSLNDQQGMTRVRDQLNQLVSAHQQILAAQNHVVKGEGPSKSASGLTTSQSLEQQYSSLSKPPLGNRAVDVAPHSLQQQQQQHQQQQQQQYQQLKAQQILGQLSAIAKSSSSSSLSSSSSSSSLLSVSSLEQQNTGAGATTAWQQHNTNPKLPPVVPPTALPSYSDVVASSNSSHLAAGGGAVQTGPIGSNTPPSLLGHIGTSSSAASLSSISSTTLTTTNTTATATTSLPASQNHVFGAAPASAAETQRAVKQIQMLMAALPEAKRPKTVQELKEFVHKYSTLINKNATPPPLPPPSAAVLSDVAKSEAQQTTGPSSGEGGGSLHTANVHVAEHFRNSLLASANKTVLSFNSSSESGSTAVSAPSVGIALSGMSVPTLPSSKQPLPSQQQSVQPLSQSQSGSFSGGSSSSSTVHAPVTTQFSQPVPKQNSVGTSTSVQATSSTTAGAGIQAGVAMPLPPGLTLETLGVLCRLPESELLKLKLPEVLLRAIRVWKARQVPGNKAKVTNTPNKNSIPVLIPPTSGELSSSASTNSTGSSMVTFTKPASNNTYQQQQQQRPAMKTSLGMPNVLPSGVGFPPRSLHAYIPGASTGGLATPHQQASSSLSSQHMTRYKLKMEQQKIKNDRLQALQKALQSSEEARIAFRFSAHLEKMHSQLMNPDTVNAFRSQHDILARLLPYHLYAEPEPPPAAVEKADAVFESVAQVLLSRSRGLKSRFEQMLVKSEAEGGSEQREMKTQLERLFIEGEQERIQKEDLEKKEAEQIAADLSLMADGVGSFDADFSFGDVFNPMMSLDSGIT